MIKQIIENFKRYMLTHDLTHAEAAEEINCCRAHLSRILQGTRTPSIALLMRMEEVMKNN